LAQGGSRRRASARSWSASSRSSKRPAARSFASGREIVEYYQAGAVRAEYGDQLLDMLIKVEHEAARRFYEIEAERAEWSVLDLERQIDTQLLLNQLGRAAARICLSTKCIDHRVMRNAATRRSERHALSSGLAALGMAACAQGNADETLLVASSALSTAPDPGPTLAQDKSSLHAVYCIGCPSRSRSPVRLSGVVPL